MKKRKRRKRRIITQANGGKEKQVEERVKKVSAVMGKMGNRKKMI